MYANHEEGKEGKDSGASTLIHNPWPSYRNEDGHVGGDDDEGREAEAQYQHEEDVDPVTQRRLHSPPWNSDTRASESGRRHPRPKGKRPTAPRVFTSRRCSWSRTVPVRNGRSQSQAGRPRTACSPRAALRTQTHGASRAIDLRRQRGSRSMRRSGAVFVPGHNPST